MSNPGGLVPSYVLKVTLDHVEPSVWRRIQVPSSITLDELHVILQVTMGWEFEHLYDFEAGKRRFSPETDDLFGMGPPLVEEEEELDEEEARAQTIEGLKQLLAIAERPEELPERQAALQSLMANMGIEDDPFGRADEDSGLVALSEVLKRARSKLIYNYDFGDSWRHTVVVEKTKVPTNPEQPVICLDGAGACPPEDCGGPWRYMDIIAMLQHPDDPEFDEEDREWLEELYGDLDPQAFDRVAINTYFAAQTWELHLQV